MRKAFRHSGVLMMMGVVALGLLGAAYTLWYEDLTVTSNVETGTFNADVSIHPWVSGTTFGDAETAVGTYPGAGRPVVIVCPEPIPGLVSVLPVMLATGAAGEGIPVEEGTYAGCVGSGFPEGKPPTVCDAEIATIPDAANDQSDNNHLILNMSGLYPLAGCLYTTDLHNAGTVPLHVSFTGGTYQICDPGDPDPINCEDLDISDPGISVGDVCYGPDGSIAVGSLTPGPISYTSGPSAGSPVQLHVDQELVCTVAIMLDQGADLEGKVIIGTRTYRTHQWNEAVN